MNLSNVKLILAREIRDQLRDRRTLFMIAVLPILLYPLLGMSFFQISQFMQEQPTRVLVVGAERLAETAAAVRRTTSSPPNLFADPRDARWLELHFASDEPRGPDGRSPTRWPTRVRQVQAGEYDAALCFPPDFAEQLERFSRGDRESRANRRAGSATPADASPQVPEPEIIYTTANEKSQIAFVRLPDVLRRWTDEVGEANLAAGGMPATAARPFELARADVADETGTAGTAMWSKILPVMLLLWALTGAFYPAVDLCAGEKERGTLETLLSSPAERSEIVLGKLLTIMLFSMVTAVLNLVSMGMTGWMVLGAAAGLRAAAARRRSSGSGVALVPISALFSALCLALAAFARSTKEGQYYLMPLLLVTMPLVDAADVARRGTEPGQQPDSRHRRGAPAAERAGRQLLAGPAVLAGRWSAVTLGWLPAGDPLGRRSVQLRIGAVPRERAAGRGAVAAAPAARPAADAHRGRGGLLRRADPGGQVLPESAPCRMPDDFGGFAVHGPGHATGR